MVNIKLMKDLDNEGFPGRKYSMLVTTEAQSLRREAKLARDNAYPGPNSRVSLGGGRGHPGNAPPTNGQEAAAGVLWGGSGDSAPKWKNLR